MTHMDKCKHLLPCGYCDVKGAKCDVFYYSCVATTSEVPLNGMVNNQPQSNVSHIHDWDLVSAYYDPIEMNRKCQYKCRICGSSKIEADN